MESDPSRGAADDAGLARFAKASGFVSFIFASTIGAWVAMVVLGHGSEAAPLLEVVKAIVFSGLGLATGVTIGRSER
ncbi:MAG TPA: hypothetical protein VI997_05350 [Candidatus Thermoplasmatota archaeon]|nr:hypothetical protein [Candidatus Thermoplasmatota archaeon]